MRDLFDELSEQPAPMVAPIRLEVDPARVKATVMFRAGGVAAGELLRGVERGMK